MREQPITPHRQLVATALGSISRMAYDEKTATLFGAFRYQGFVEHVGAIDTRSGAVTRLADIKQAMLYRVASFALRRDTRTAFYTNDNLAWRDLMAVDVDSGVARRLLQDARIGEIAFSRSDRALYGVRHHERPGDAGARPVIRIRRAGRNCTRFPTARSPTTSTSRPTASGCRLR